MMIHL